MVFRRFLAFLFLSTAALSGLASLTVSRGDQAPTIASLGEIFDATTNARSLRKQVSLWRDEEAERSQTIAEPSALVNSLQETILNEPLNAPAFTALALIMQETGDSRFPDFIDAATDASPRTPSLIALQLERAAQRSDQMAALRLLDRAMRLRPARMREFMPQFVARIANDPDAFALEEGLLMEPLWARQFLSLAADEPNLLPRIAQVRVENPSAAISNEAVDAKLARRSAEAGDYMTAWRIFRLNRQSQPGTLQFDTQFIPFDWSLTADAAQTALLREKGTLEIDFLTGGGEAAAQVVPLRQMPSRLTAEIRREGEGDNDITVIAACVSGGEAETSVLIAPDAKALSLSMPQPCRFARIAISTERRYSTTPTVVTLDNLSIR
ncbi:hypothetical protein [Aurantiacibacter aquimixticola]|uniref:Tetratricopeptide repeat protein n=1 Tax=Aurantiacibacter aquimixticola TaxID=1958945 RepID=A0A419RSG8_9SPHN|nr:hypothetical protein [Aurantiacibacter aquimixticola]RJY08728.1 hypothetical protein D6201_04575 [Aurantiacibacter aquimixticola]